MSSTSLLYWTPVLDAQKWCLFLFLCISLSVTSCGTTTWERGGNRWKASVSQIQHMKRWTTVMREHLCLCIRWSWPFIRLHVYLAAVLCDKVTYWLNVFFSSPSLQMPRLWIDYCQFMVSQCKITRSRRTFDRALRALPVTQHPRIWPLYLRFGRNLPLPETAIRVFRRYLKVRVGRYAEYQTHAWLSVQVDFAKLWGGVRFLPVCCDASYIEISIDFLFLCPVFSCLLRMQRNISITCVQLDVWMKLLFDWQLWSMMKTLFLKRENPIIRSATDMFCFMSLFTKTSAVWMYYCSKVYGYVFFRLHWFDHKQK